MKLFKKRVQLCFCPTVTVPDACRSLDWFFCEATINPKAEEFLILNV